MQRDDILWSCMRSTDVVVTEWETYILTSQNSACLYHPDRMTKLVTQKSDVETCWWPEASIGYWKLICDAFICLSCGVYHTCTRIFRAIHFQRHSDTRMKCTECMVMLCVCVFWKKFSSVFGPWQSIQSFYHCINKRELGEKNQSI